MAMAEVAVVGAGMAGSAAAWWAARRGHDVVVLEQFSRCHTRGSSHGRSRIFRLAYPDPFYVRMAEQATELWDELEETAGVSVRTTTGGLDHGRWADVDAVRAALEECGVRHETMSQAAAAERWPGLRFGERVLYQPDGGRIDADATLRAFQAGIPVRFDTPVERIELRGDGVIVHATTGSLKAGAVIIAAGAWTARVLDGLVPLPPLTVTQEQYVHFQRTSPESFPWPSIIHHAGRFVYSLATPDAGVKVAEHHTGVAVDPNERMEPDAAGMRRIEAYARDWMPALDATTGVAETCLYTTTPNEDFFIERTGPIIAASPCSGHGFKFAPLIGRLLCDLIEDPDAAPQRFSARALSDGS
jgi:sarcosine oxidase